MRISTCTFLCLFTLLASPLARADILPPGHKGVTHRILVEGLSRFPDVTFVVYPTSFSDSMIVLQEGEPFSFYKLSRPYLYALRGEVPDTITKEDLAADGVARSNIPFELISSVPESDPTERIHTTYGITGIDGDTVMLEKGGSLRYDQENQLVGSLERGAPVVLAAIAMVALCGIVLLVWLRRRGALAAGGRG